MHVSYSHRYTQNISVLMENLATGLMTNTRGLSFLWDELCNAGVHSAVFSIEVGYSRAFDAVVKARGLGAVTHNPTITSVESWK